jgi:protein O-GlcNAcase / histone acetyltransferase
MTHESGQFLSGVIEGFYGKPWTAAERAELLAWMGSWGLNTYVYAPKDDLHHRALWREQYNAADAAELSGLIQACRDRGVRFVYALSPGLDIRYSGESEIARICDRFAQMLRLGCRDFSLLFDDIPDDLAQQDVERWGSLAAAQSHVANTVLAWTRDRAPGSRALFCPTAYSGGMAARKLGGDGYLETLGRQLDPAIDIFWTGPSIVSREITTAHVADLQRVLRRKPLIWDNLNANDYDGRRFFCGPYAGRAPELRGMVAGLLSNPNNEFPLNYVPLRSLARFVSSDGAWNARESYLSALHEWLPSFATVGAPIPFADLVLFCDCFYLPHEDGAEANAFYERARRLVTSEPPPDPDAAAVAEQTKRLRNVCDRITELRHRPMFHALYRRIWDLREQLDLLERYAAFRSGHAGADPTATRFPLPAARHPGMVARLRQLVIQHAGPLAEGISS